MTKHICRIALATLLGPLAGCASSDGNQVTGAKCISPVGPDCKIPVADGSLVRWTAPVTDGVAGGVSTGVVQHSPGQYCMSGTVDEGPNGSGWGAILLLELAPTVDSAGTMATVTPIDVSARGITQVRFTVDDPPMSGILPQMVEIENAACKTIPDCVATFGAPTTLFQGGAVTLPLAAFAAPDADHPNTTLDPTLVTAIQFYVSSVPGRPLNYDFCIHDLAFLDASGKEIGP